MGAPTAMGRGQWREDLPVLFSSKVERVSIKSHLLCRVPHKAGRPTVIRLGRISGKHLVQLNMLELDHSPHAAPRSGLHDIDVAV